VPSGGTGFAGAARRQARDILSHPPFTTAHGQSALSRFFSDLGHWLYDVAGPVWHFILRYLLRPTRSGLENVFGSWWPVVLGVAVLAVATGVGLTLGRRRARAGADRWVARAAHRDVDPDALDAAAATAERAGDFAMAVRLRFQAGLARLERSGLVSGGRTHTSAQLGSVLRSPTFDELAGQLDAILYAGIPARAEHAGAARAGWPHVPEEARRSAAERPVAAAAVAVAPFPGDPRLGGGPSDLGASSREPPRGWR